MPDDTITEILGCLRVARNELLTVQAQLRDNERRVVHLLELVDKAIKAGKQGL